KIVRDKRIRLTPRFQSLKLTAYHYRNFPIYSTTEALSNAASIQLPIVLISSLALGPEAGFLILAMQVMQAPLLLIGNSVSQVYLSSASRKAEEETLGEFTITIVTGLFKAGVGPLICFVWVAPTAFEFIFGSEWRRAGE